MSRRYRDREFLREKYCEENQSVTEIAEICNVGSSTISRWLDRHDIEQRYRYQEEEWLHRQYVERDKDQQEIADICGIGKTTVCHWLARTGITEGSSLQEGTCKTCGDEFRYYPSVREGRFCSNRCAKDQQKRQVRVTCPNCDTDFSRWESLDTQYCSMECWGEDHRVYSEDWYRGRWCSQRQKALERDEYQCTVCDISDEEHKRKFGRSLDVHHIIPIRLFAIWDVPVDDAHELRKLQTVCRTHHPDSPGTTA